MPWLDSNVAGRSGSPLSLVVAGFCLCVMLAIVVSVREAHPDYATDFAAFYAGGKLVGSGDLYDLDALRREEQRHIGGFSPTHGYVRLPFHAVLFRPLTYLDYTTAEWVWHAVRAAAVGVFIFLWPTPDWRMRLAWTCLSLPLFGAFVNGQDSPLLPGLIAVALHLHRRGNARAAGMAASICAIKPHLFLLVPVWIVARREFRMLQGLAAGALVWTAVSFLGSGPHWPAEWFRAATSSRFSPSIDQMPNLYGVFAWMGVERVAEPAAALAVAVGVWVAARHGGFAASLSGCLVGGLLVSRHAYLTDMVILLPAAFAMLSDAYGRYARLCAILVIFPATAYATLTGARSTAAVVVIICIFFGLVVWEAARIDPSRRKRDPSLIPEADDGVQPRGAVRRIVSKE